jgi:hypothetical protein
MEWTYRICIKSKKHTGNNTRISEADPADNRRFIFINTMKNRIRIAEFIKDPKKVL